MSVIMDRLATVQPFFLDGQFKGLFGSSGPSHVTLKGSFSCSSTTAVLKSVVFSMSRFSRSSDLLDLERASASSFAGSTEGTNVLCGGRGTEASMTPWAGFPVSSRYLSNSVVSFPSTNA